MTGNSVSVISSDAEGTDGKNTPGLTRVHILQTNAKCVVKIRLLRFSFNNQYNNAG